ncbi:MAG: M48 family metalloprotease [Desulfobacteraceae bacterium]|nr:M48 family metalloprotease [Desulfobacteraceae bacterium]
MDFSCNLTRRSFLQLSSMTAAGWLAGCAANPVTGKSQFMIISEQQEIDLDKKNSPHQFSADYGPAQDQRLSAYINQTGQSLASLSHRPQMPYAFQVVNATYVNAYAFPGGSIAVTRGILLELDNEAELAALLGHELGHVNARHTAQSMSKSALTSALVGGVSMIIGAKSDYGGLAAQLGMLGSGALLASYSRANERQADDLGMEYLVKAGYSSGGMVGLMDMLNGMSKHMPSFAELLFSTHPMSKERYDTAIKTSNSKYSQAKGLPLHRERYMDNIAGLRKIQSAIKDIQKGEKALGLEKYAEAESAFKSALKTAPDDYAGLVIMAKCQLVQEKADMAGKYLEKALAVYPEEAQAHYLSGYVKLNQKQYQKALARFDTYNKKLPGNPNVTFFKGFAHEGMSQNKQAAEYYHSFLKVVNEGNNAKHAYARLVEWGYIKK